MSAEEVDCMTMTQILHMHTIETTEKQNEALNMIAQGWLRWTLL